LTPSKVQERKGMEMGFSPTSIKNWYQYRCERKTVYEAMPSKDRAQIPILENLVHREWAEFGDAFEQQVVADLRRREPGQVLEPPPGEKNIEAASFLRFLRRQRRETYAYQPVLRETPVLRAVLNLAEGLKVRDGRADLIIVTREAPTPEFAVADVKATRNVTLFHRAQVAFYSLILRGMLKELGVDGDLSEMGQVWRLADEEGRYQGWKPEFFPLRNYESMVEDFFRREVPVFASRRVTPRQDQTRFHIYFKCEQCQFLTHCRKAIEEPLPSESWDVSAVPGMSSQAKRALEGLHVKTTGALSRSRLTGGATSQANWALRTRGEMYTARARSIVEGRSTRLEEQYSWLMPPEVDTAIHLVVDSDPIEGRLVTLGCMVESAEGRKETIRIITDAESELTALEAVLGQVVATLASADALNREQQAGIRAHIYTYEPTEAMDLQEALGRRLSHPGVRAGLLHLVRMFPPEDLLVREPEYAGVHHLPASVVRSLIDQHYALPVVVSHALHRVTSALLQASPPIEKSYEPATEFRREFSSRLSIDICRRLSRGALDPREVEADVRKRLEALSALRRWLEADNARAKTPFLRLRKQPFLFQSQFDPLAATDLDVLQAREILHNRSGLLAELTELARPAPIRRERLRCFAGLRLLKEWEGNRDCTLLFTVPDECREVELSSSDFALILSDDNPDIRLDPSLWPAFHARISEDLDERKGTIQVRVRTSVFRGERFQRLLKGNPRDNWFLDRTFSDPNTERMTEFLTFLARE